MGHEPTAGQAKLIALLIEFFTIPLSRPVFVMRGYAGTGKTSLVSAFIKAMPPASSVLLAPTGRAAKVFGAYSKRSAFTIHKKIYRKKSAVEFGSGFSLSKNTHTDTLFIVDESSMIPGDVQEGQYFGAGSLLSDLITYVYEYNNFDLNKDDFMKRKRVKSMVPVYERCCAKRANGEQCTRRKQDDCQFCGTHSKGTPHGMISDKEPLTTTKKVEVNAIDIKGIVYYLDNDNNVYDTEDIISNNKNPRVIAKYVKNGNDYSIPELFGN